MSRSVTSLDKDDCRILRRLNAGPEEPKPALKSRFDGLREAGFVEDKGFGGVGITLRGQLALARWRFRNLSKPRYVVSGSVPGAGLFGRFFKTK